MLIACQYSNVVVFRRATGEVGGGGGVRVACQ
jgi:hypothetical protein